MAERNAAYEKTVRRLRGKADIAFYENCDDNDAEVYLNGDGLESDPAAHLSKKQIISTGLIPAYRYATLDGLTKPDGSCRLLSRTAETVFPLWSKSVCGADGTFAAADVPIYRLEYTAARPVSRVLIVGEERWEQGAAAYRLRLYVPEGEEPTDGAETEAPETYAARTFTAYTAKDSVTEDGKNYDRYSFDVTVTDGAYVRQCVLTGKIYPAEKIELEILGWSAGSTTAKIMYFSDDIRMVCEDEELQGIDVLEEKTDAADSLSYGITSNTCTVKVRNKGNRFVNSPDLLKKNRIVRPSVKEDADGEWRSLGKYYSDSWEVSSSSEFVTCKSFDVLYNLQKMNLRYPMEQDEQGNYVMDGTVNGTAVQSAYDVFVKLFRLINEERIANGIFGAEINAEIDEKLKDVTFDYVCLGCDTAWNLLQTTAYAAQCYVYADRAGSVRIVRDKFADEDTTATEETDATEEPISITPSNSFSYNLPTMSHAIVNRVTVPYCLLDSTDAKVEDDQFTIEPKDFEYDEDGNVILNLSLKNFYPKISAIQLCDDDFRPVQSLPLGDIAICYDQIQINRGIINDIQKIKIITPDNECIKLKTGEHVYNDFNSQKRNGVVEFELKSGNLLFGVSQAQTVCEKIVEKYSEGVSYIETDWRGTPLLELGDTVASCSRKNPKMTEYECLSNEFSYDGGLRVKTKARKISAS